MKDIEVKKRGWVKNVAIVFLAVMLVLTFFSNTIMNRSLPEVSAQYTTSGAITARIRGSGTVEANAVFDVEFTQTRKVVEIPVRKGDEVNIGDLLIRLSGAESAELEGAKEALRVAEDALEDALVESSKGSGAVGDAARAVQSARYALNDAQQTLAEKQQILAEKQQALAGVNFNEAAYNAALAANNHAQSVINRAETARIAAMQTTSARQLALSTAEAELAALESAPGVPLPSVDPGVYELALQKVRDAQYAFDIASAASTAAAAAVTAAEDAAAAPKAELALQEQNRDDWIAANDAVRSANDAVRVANSAVREAQLSLDSANANLSLVQSSENVDDSLEALRLRRLRRDVEEAKEKIVELEKESTGTEITSPVGGIITDINVNVNSDTTPDEPLMVIEIVDRGYSLNFRVSAEQASRVNLGDMAEVDRGWWSWGDEIRATLIGIRNDPQNPVLGRLLHFNIQGDVESGDQLNLILAQRSENYNVIVPTSAIRTDTNGDFVLVVMSRTSPLGNRYIATRVDVNILASDDTNTAVSGGLSGWDFVITFASVPIDPGMQVRLVDNP